MDGTGHAVLEFGRFRLEQDGGLWRGRKRVPLPPKETALLRLLAERGGRVVSKTELLDRLWRGEDVGDASITRCVRGLRSALREGGRRGGTIETVYGRGYRLAMAVQATEPLDDGASADTLRVGVIPFENTSGRGDDDYLGPGVAGEVTDALAKTLADGITVVARQSAARLRRGARDPFRSARELRLDYVVTGWLRFEADELRVQVELVRIRDETLVWTERFQARPSLLPGLASAIASEAARELGRQGSCSSPRRPRRTHAVQPKSYLALLQGQFASQLRTERGVRRAIALFDHAIAWDPDNAEAYAASADAHLVLAFWGYEAPLATAPRVRSLLQRALSLDRRLAPAHATLAYLRYAIDFNPAAATRAVSRALALEPGHARSLWIQGLILQAQGHLDAALAAYEAARDSDPFSPQLALGIAFDLFCMGRLEPALAAARALTASEPEFALGHATRATFSAVAGRTAEAIRSAEIAEGLARGNCLALGTAAWALANAGRAARAAEIRAALERKAARRYVNPSYLALAALGLGDTEAAIAALERGLEQRCMFLPYLGVDPRFAPLRGDARFERIAACARGAPDPLAR